MAYRTNPARTVPRRQPARLPEGILARLDESRGLVSMGRSATFPLPQWVADDASRTVFFDEGEGRTLVFVHGLGGNVTHWEYVLPALGPGHRVVGLDLVGFGASAKPRVDYTVERLCQHLESFLADRGIRKAVLVGHSMGGLVSLATALRRPDLVEGLVMLSAVGIAPMPGWARAGARLALHPGLLYPALRRGHDFILDHVFVDGPDDNPHVRHFRVDTLQDVEGALPHLRDFARVSASACRDIVRQDLSGRLDELEMPVMVIWGDRDHLIRLPGLDRRLSAIPRLRKVLLPRTGHLAMIERPREVVEAVLSFLADLDAPDRAP